MPVLLVVINTTTYGSLQVHIIDEGVSPAVFIQESNLNFYGEIGKLHIYPGKVDHDGSSTIDLNIYQRDTELHIYVRDNEPFIYKMDPPESSTGEALNLNIE